MEAIGGRSPALASINVHGPVRHLEPKQRAMGGCASQPAAAVKPSIEGEAHSGTEERRVSVVIEQNLSLDFEKVMDAEEGVHALLTFARSEFNDEVLLFWLDIVRLKRDLADASLWSGKGGGCHSNATVSEPTGNATGGGDDNLFDEGNPFDDNPFDADGDAPTRHVACAEVTALGATTLRACVWQATMGALAAWRRILPPGLHPRPRGRAAC